MRISETRLASYAAVTLLACAVVVQAQDAPSTPKPESRSASTSADDRTSTVQAGQGGVTINGRHFPRPMTGIERWNKYEKNTFTTFPIYAASLGAALGDQSRNDPPAWGQTWEGYGKRAGTQYATFAIQTSVYQGGSALLRNEGRYIACQCNGPWHRAGYALQMSFFTYHDLRKLPDVPQFVAAYASGMIPITWYPQGYSVSGKGVQNGTYQLGLVVVVREIQEFAPELKHFFGRLKP